MALLLRNAFTTVALLSVLLHPDSIAGTEAGADTSASPQKAVPQLEQPVVFADTIPPEFFQIVDNLGLNRYTVRLISRFETIPEDVILQSLAAANKEVNYQRSGAFAVVNAIKLLCQRDSLWNDFFSDLELQLREPNILRINFRDNQKWKSYALNELFYSEFFQELLLSIGNIGIAASRDGREWLDGWPDELRWKYREYRFEYMPENMNVKVIDLRSLSRRASGEKTTSTLRLLPSKPVLPVESGDSVEPPLKIPNL